MKRNNKKHIKNIFKNDRYFRCFTAFLIVIVFSSFVNGILSEQSISSPDNPMEGIADNVSTVALAGSSTSESNDTTEEEQEEKQEDKKEDNKESENKENDNDSEEDKEATETNKNDTSIGDNTGDSGGKNEDSSNISIVKPDTDKNSNNLNVNNYFTTTIKDDEIVMKENYSFSIIQKNHGLEVNKTEVFLNEDLIDDFDGTIKLTEIKNTIKVKVTYENKKGKLFSVSRQYTIYYNLEDIVIITSLKDGMKVTNPELSFTANAKKEDKDLDVIVKFDEKEIAKEGKNNYKVLLNEGENKISISASADDDFEEKIFTINYVKHYPELTIVTDIKEYQEIRKAGFSFNAVAKVEDREVEIAATQNGLTIKGDKDGNYKINLLEGSNYIVLKASDGDKSTSKQYEIMYEYRPEEEDENWEDPKKPVMETDLKDGITVKSNKFNIWVKGKDYNGNKLNVGHIEVKANSKVVPKTWTDGDQTSYTIPIVNGTNQVLITVWDDNNNLVQKEYIVKGIVIEDGDVIGHATFSIEASTIGIGSIISPTKVEIRQGEPASYVLNGLLKQKGFTYSKTGKLNTDFYLSHIRKPGLVSNPNIPADLDELLQQSGFGYYPEDYQTDSLGEFDFSQGSGWMVSVNGHYTNYGFADMFLVDGDVVRIRFTLAYGRDINGSGGMGGDNGSDWGEW